MEKVTVVLARVIVGMPFNGVVQDVKLDSELVMGNQLPHARHKIVIRRPRFLRVSFFGC